MLKKILQYFTLLITTLPAAAQDIQYTVTFPNAIHHEAEITLYVAKPPSGELTVQMSRSSPGRYATHEFGKNIYDLKAFDSTGKPLNITQLDGGIYRISNGGRSATITYTVFGNRTDGTYNSISESHAHFNMPASFMWVAGLEKRPVEIDFQIPEKYGWQVITQLKPLPGKKWFAPSLQYLMDSPTELSVSKISSWEVVGNDGKKQTIMLASHSVDAQVVVDSFAVQLKKVTAEAQAVFGELPAFDYGEYRFIHDVASDVSGDGMEHRNSTIITQPGVQIAGREKRLLSTFSHEFFHAWNVERIRPKSLEPFDFTHANMSSELWFAEGFTEYYGELLLHRAGVKTKEEYAGITASLINGVLNSAGAARFPATQMSRYAIYADAGVSIDPTNQGNIFTSYYTYGGAIALGLDLMLRSRYQTSLDIYMQNIWHAYGKTEIAYTIPDLQKQLATLTKDDSFAADFFNRYVYGIEKIDYTPLLEKAGFILEKEQPGKAWMGILRTTENNGIVRVSEPTKKNTPVYNAGIDADDILLTIDGKKLKHADQTDKILNKKKPGDVLEITFENRTGVHHATVSLIENPRLIVKPAETSGKPLTAAQTIFRAEWLASKQNIR